MSGRIIPRAECITGARSVLDQARRRIAADYAAGRLSPEQTAAYERLITRARLAAAA
jgi:hypothetical protein